MAQHMASASPAHRPVGSVARALALLDLLAANERGLGVNELARRISVSASTASRLLATLEAGGLVERAAEGGPFRLGRRLVALADRVLARLDVRELARPVLLGLVQRTGETATLSVSGVDGAITIDFVPSPASVASMARLGRPSVAHATATGKVMLAYDGERYPPERKLTPFTERTITDRRALDAELQAVRSRGYAESFGEREADLGAIAAPIFDRTGALAAILGLQGPSARLDRATSAEKLPLLLQAAGELTRALGGT
jgi:IclR family acetate operon transcriptional repressor